jgi:hypothetical protein
MRRRPTTDPRRSRLVLGARVAFAVGVVVLVAFVPGAGSVAQQPLLRPEAGEDLTAAQFHALVVAAQTDPGALERLREVRSVEGRPVDVDAVLAGATGPAQQQRLAQLATATETGSSAGTPVSPTAERKTASKILDGDKFQPTRLPRPFRGVLTWLGDRLEPVVGPISRFFASLVSTPAGAVLVAVAVALAAGGLARWIIGRRTRAVVRRREAHRRIRGDEDPADLDRRADAAEADGDLERALRLRFRAGLVRLDRSGALAH